MTRSTVGGWTALWLAMTISSGLAADFGDGVRAYNAGDYIAAFAAWLPLAESGDAAASRNLGHLYRTGRGVAEDPAQALHWYRSAAEQGFAAAQANLGDMFARGQGVAADFATAALWFHRAAVQGHVAAQYNLGLLYENGLGVEQNENVAMAWYHRAAGLGHEAALERLSRLVAGGTNPASNEELALEPAAMGSPVDRPTEAIEPLVGTLSVTERLGIGRDAFRVRDYASALEAWAPLAEDGNAIAQFRIGGLYADGSGVAADPAEARKWWTLAADQGHDKAAQLLAALASEPDAAEQARPASAGDLAPEPVRQEALTAAEPADPAAGEGVLPPPDAPVVSDENRLATLGSAERLAAGVDAYRTKEYGLAVTAWLPLAEAGGVWAQFYLGGLYHDGHGVPANLARAHMWWTLATRSGHQVARELLTELEMTMDADARAEADALAAVWRSRE